MQILFQIEEISAGWFDIHISCEGSGIYITNSNYLGNDAPQILLQNMAELCEADGERWLCWNDEPGAFIWHLSKRQEIMSISISIAQKESWKLAFEGETLKEEKTKEELFYLETSFSGFARQVIKAFGIYSSREKLALYKEEWGEFPEKEYNLLKKGLKEIKNKIG